MKSLNLRELIHGILLLEASKSNNHKYEYGALILKVNFPDWNEILETINKNDLYTDEPGFGLEKEPHVTALFGFKKGSDFEKIKKLTKENCFEPVEITTKNLSSFSNEKFDVLKFDIKSKQMYKLNKIMRDNFDYVNNFPDYHPHMTVAYLKKGNVKKYLKKQKERKFLSKEFVYNSPDNNEKRKFEI